MAVKFVIIGGGPAGNQAATYAARLGADLDDFPGAREVIIEAEDGMAAAIEHECLPRVRLLESGDLTKSPGYVGWNGVDRLQHVRCEGRQRRDQHEANADQADTAKQHEWSAFS